MEAPILNCEGTSLLYAPKKLRWVPPSFKDRSGKPLFHDLAGEELLEETAIWNEERIRYAIGLDSVQWYHFFGIVDGDAKQTGCSMIKSVTDNDWHTRVATFLANKALDWLIGGSQFPPMLAQTPFLPLENGLWISREECLVTEVYFEHPGSYDIPNDPAVNFVDLRASSVVARRLLFCLLGVKNVDPKKTMEFIGQCYQTQVKPTLDESFLHLKYLFWLYPESVLDSNILVYNDRGQLVHPQSDVYAEDSSLGQLHNRITESGTKEQENPGEDPVLHHGYLSAVPEAAVSHGRTWKAWLKEIVGIKIRPPVLKYVAEQHPDKLLALLASNLKSYYQSSMTPTLRGIVQEARVPTSANTDHPLKDCYFPSARLTSTFPLDLRLTPPFAKLPHEWDGCEEQWSFLKDFGVQFEDDINFYATVLRSLSSGNSAPHHQVLELAVEAYNGMMDLCIRRDTAAEVKYEPQAAQLPCS